MYHLQENINEETLVNDEQFITDATSFLMKREGKDLQDLATNKDVYDAFMEHFRYQNVNEVTATRDLLYAQDADTESKNEFHRLIPVDNDSDLQDLWNTVSRCCQKFIEDNKEKEDE